MYNPTLALAHIRYDRFSVWLLCGLLGALFSVYMYFVVGSIVDIVLHKELLVSIQETESRIGELETSYFTHLNSLTPDLLPEYGLVVATPRAYVSVAEAADKLTKRD